MSRNQVNPRVRAGVTIGALLGVALALGCGPASAEPPVRSAEDAACRLEARARVFSTPNPRGLEPEEIGRGLYHACMRRLGASEPRRPRPRRRHRRR